MKRKNWHDTVGHRQEPSVQMDNACHRPIAYRFRRGRVDLLSPELLEAVPAHS